MTVEEAIRALRADPQYQDLIRDAYLSSDVNANAAAFENSAEFAEVRRMVSAHITGKTVVDLGAGNGIASYAMARAGASQVLAVEPDPSFDVGRGAIENLKGRLPIFILDAFGEELPIDPESVDLVYVRQVLHHAKNLQQLIRQCARVLRPGGLLVACREHVADNEKELRAFLSNHPVHRIAGNEHAYRLQDYLEGITSAGLTIKEVLGPWDSIINAFPVARTVNDLERVPDRWLDRRFGRLGRIAVFVPGVRSAVWCWLRLRKEPGRMYTFLATKPSRNV